MCGFIKHSHRAVTVRHCLCACAAVNTMSLWAFRHPLIAIEMQQLVGFIYPSTGLDWSLCFLKH